MSSSILKDYMQYLSSDSLSPKNESFKEKESNSKNDSQEKSQQFLKDSSEHTVVINFSYQETYKYKIICKNCQNFPQISLNDNYTLNLICNCKSKTGVKFDYFIDNYIVKDNISLLSQINSKIFVENYCFCETHDRPFSYYCDSCSRDLVDLIYVNFVSKIIIYILIIYLFFLKIKIFIQKLSSLQILLKSKKK